MLSMIEKLIFLFFIFLFLSFCFLGLFQKKLISLMVLEGFFVCYLFFFFLKGVSFSLFLGSFSLILCVLLVLDSVLGLSMLIGASRNSSYFSMFFSYL